MSHPTNRRHRFLIGVNKGMKRVSNWFFDNNKVKQKKGIEIQARRHRDTTKICGGDCCKNPRNSGWNSGTQKLTMQELKFEEMIKLDL